MKVHRPYGLSACTKELDMLDRDQKVDISRKLSSS